MRTHVPIGALLCAALAAGCVTSRVPETASWLLETEPAAVKALPKPAFGAARLAFAGVRAPYDGKAIALLRADGSVAFDPYNQFAALPSALVRAKAPEILAATGAFARVFDQTSTVDAKTSLELTVDRLALDGRQEDGLRAVAEVTLVAVERRQAVATGRGAATVGVKDGNFSAAFGSAFAQALVQAAQGLGR